MKRGTLAMAFLLAGLGAPAQVLDGIRSRVGGLAGGVRELRISAEEELRMGQDVSGRIRLQYGVVQDAALHRYVALVGSLLAPHSGPGYRYHFIVLDTDGVNAFAAPGGYIHITRGALALLESEAELAGVLGHEMAHVALRHSIRAIQKGKLARMAAEQGSLSAHPELYERLTDECYNVVFAGFSRADEHAADQQGLGYAVAAGYEGEGLGRFLGALQSRNSGSDTRQGLFDSHPELSDRRQRLAAALEAGGRRGGVQLRARYARHVHFRPIPLAGIALAVEGSAGLSGAKPPAKAPDEEGEKRKGRFSLGRLRNPLSAGEQGRQSGAVTGSGGSRAVDKERSARGGPVSVEVPVALTEREIAAFRNEGRLGG